VDGAIEGLPYANGDGAKILLGLRFLGCRIMRREGRGRRRIKPLHLERPSFE
jgi:hypothetical protein